MRRKNSSFNGPDELLSTRNNKPERRTKEQQSNELSRQMEEFEAKNGPVKTQDIVNRSDEPKKNNPDQQRRAANARKAKLDQKTAQSCTRTLG